MQHRYILEPYKTPASRYSCPQCGRAKKFTRYIDAETNAPLASHAGKCDRVESCGYHFTPKQYFAANPNQQPPKTLRQTIPAVPAQPNFIPYKLFKQSLRLYGQNHFVQYLSRLFEEETLYRLITDYCLGTSKHWPGATIFWQADAGRNIHTGKIMLYNPLTGKRVKQPVAHIAWVHKLIGMPGFNLQQCLFGQHLLGTDASRVVALVESEKTAVIAAGYMPQYCWLATGGLDGLTHQRCKVLHGRTVLLFPDADGLVKWEAKMRYLRLQMPGTSFTLAQCTNSLKPPHQGTDIADWLTGFI